MNWIDLYLLFAGVAAIFCFLKVFLDCRATPEKSRSDGEKLEGRDAGQAPSPKQTHDAEQSTADAFRFGN